MADANSDSQSKRPTGDSAPAPSKPQRSAAKLSLAQSAGSDWVLVHPRCARQRREDLEEVEQMIAGGEQEIARDELRWLLDECHDFLAAHKILGDLALAEGDYRLARGHYGYAYQLGIQAIDANGGAKRLSYAEPANQAFFQAGRGLLLCLTKLNKRGPARDVTNRLLQFDAGDPLGLRRLSDSGCGQAKPSRRK
jgi:hypothetical protein